MRPFCFAVLACMGLVSEANADPIIRRVDVFVSDSAPIAAGAEAKALASSGVLVLWNVDDLERFNTRMAQNLPRDLAAAKRVVAERVAALTPDERMAVANAATGVSRADGFKVTRLPAVLVNEAHLYYGPRNVEEALAAYRAKPGSAAPGADQPEQTP